MIDLTEVVAAIQARLTGDAGIVAIVPAANIGNFLPQDVPYPHIFWQTKGDLLAVKDEVDWTITLQLDIYSDSKGSKECLQIANLIENALEGIPLTIASGDCFGTNVQSFDAQLEPDGRIYRGIAVYQLLYGAN